jgi:hypothetical protein
MIRDLLASLLGAVSPEDPNRTSALSLVAMRMNNDECAVLGADSDESDLVSGYDDGQRMQL